MSKVDRDDDIFDSPILQFVGKILITSSIIFLVVYFLTIILGIAILTGL